MGGKITIIGIREGDKRGGKTRARRTSLDTIQYIAVDRENGGRK